LHGRNVDVRENEELKILSRCSEKVDNGPYSGHVECCSVPRLSAFCGSKRMHGFQKNISPESANMMTHHFGA
jgi:hypothetical protein